eukprot:6213722-Pleurochrysis_carterae.AAC.2
MRRQVLHQVLHEVALAEQQELPERGRSVHSEVGSRSAAKLQQRATRKGEMQEAERDPIESKSQQSPDVHGAVGTDDRFGAARPN